MNRFRSVAAGRRMAAAAGLAALTAGPMLALSTAAAAAPEDGEPSITVSATDGLEAGQSLSVEGTGLDPEAGYYVATCVIGSESPAGPSCSGDRAVPGSQLWVSNTPGATTPIAPDGTFTGELGVVPVGRSMTGAPVDCTASDCAVTLFYDHRNGFGTLTEIPVAFSATAAEGPAADEAGGAAQATASDNAEGADAAEDDADSSALWWGIGGSVVAVVVIGGGAAALRARRGSGH